MNFAHDKLLGCFEIRSNQAAERINCRIFIHAFRADAQTIVHLDACGEDEKHAFGVDRFGPFGQVFDLDTGGEGNGRFREDRGWPSVEAGTM
jgi:hypothetical protein